MVVLYRQSLHSDFPSLRHVRCSTSTCQTLTNASLGLTFHLADRVCDDASIIIMRSDCHLALTTRKDVGSRPTQGEGGKGVRRVGEAGGGRGVRERRRGRRRSRRLSSSVFGFLTSCQLRRLISGRGKVSDDNDDSDEDEQQQHYTGTQTKENRQQQKRHCTVQTWFSRRHHGNIQGTVSTPFWVTVVIKIYSDRFWPSKWSQTLQR